MKPISYIVIGSMLALAGTAFASTLNGISLIENNQQIPGQTIRKYHDNDTGADCYTLAIQGEVPSASISCIK
jgi:hypothetical protein